MSVHFRLAPGLPRASMTTMDIKSKLVGRTITRWDPGCFEQEYPSNHSTVELVLTGTRHVGVTITRDGLRMTTILTPEAVEWLNGQTEPPVEPLRKGDYVRYLGTTWWIFQLSIHETVVSLKHAEDSDAVMHNIPVEKLERA